MKRRSGILLASAVVSLGLLGLKTTATAQDLMDPTTNWPTIGHQSKFDLRINNMMPFLPGPNTYYTLDALRSIGFTNQNIIDVIHPLMDYRMAVALRQSDEMAAVRETSASDVAEDSSEAYTRFRSRADRIWAVVSDRVGPEKCARLRDLVGDPIPVVVTTTAYTDEHLANIDRLMAEWDKESQERMARIQERKTVEEQVTTVTPAPQPQAEAPAPQPQAEAPAPAPQPEAVAPAPAPQPEAVAPTPVHRGRAHRRVRGLG